MTDRDDNRGVDPSATSANFDSDVQEAARVRHSLETQPVPHSKMVEVVQVGADAELPSRVAVVGKVRDPQAPSTLVERSLGDFSVLYRGRSLVNRWGEPEGPRAEVLIPVVGDRTWIRRDDSKGVIAGFAHSFARLAHADVRGSMVTTQPRPKNESEVDPDRIYDTLGPKGSTERTCLITIKKVAEDIFAHAVAGTRVDWAGVDMDSKADQLTNLFDSLLFASEVAGVAPEDRPLLASWYADVMLDSLFRMASSVRRG